MQVLNNIQSYTRGFGRVMTCVLVLWITLIGLRRATGTGSPSDLSASKNVAPSQAHLIETISLPLNNGRLELGDLLGALADLVSLDGQAARNSIQLGIDVHGTLGKAKVSAIEKLTRGVMTITVEVDALTITVDRLQLRRNEKALRTKFRHLVQTWFPKAADRVAEQYGLWQHTNPEDWKVKTRPTEATLFNPKPANVGGNDHGSKRVVLLLHGVDEPGKVWRSLIPALLNAGHTPIRFEYPNDQPLAESADALADAMVELRTLGVDHVDMVAHSMGGLVCREWLTNPEAYHLTNNQHIAPPTVGRLIMVGTPNQGSELARLRLAAEFRDQIERAISGDGLLFGSIFDGAGEAKIDLLPNSDFLTELNARPNPNDVELTIIAGIASPVSAERVKNLTLELHNSADSEAKAYVYEIGKALQYIVEGIGDGAVSVRSTRLQGVEDHVKVQGNHLSMIRNFLASSTRRPPAIEIILDRFIDCEDPKPQS